MAGLGERGRRSVCWLAVIPIHTANLISPTATFQFLHCNSPTGAPEHPSAGLGDVGANKNGRRSFSRAFSFPNITAWGPGKSGRSWWCAREQFTHWSCHFQIHLNQLYINSTAGMSHAGETKRISYAQAFTSWAVVICITVVHCYKKRLCNAKIFSNSCRSLQSNGITIQGNLLNLFPKVLRLSVYLCVCFITTFFLYLYLLCMCYAHIQVYEANQTKPCLWGVKSVLQQK